MEDLRKHLLFKWLTDTCGLQSVTLWPMRGDASLRRYFRVNHQGVSYVAMDAPAERETCVPFIAISRMLRQAGLLTPEVLHSDLAHGFLLLTDFGNQQLLSQLTEQNAETLYLECLANLKRLQLCPGPEGYTIQPFTAHFMQQELMLSKEWFMETHLKVTLSALEEQILQQAFYFLAETAASQPQVFMHRDFHSANLMCLPEGKIGILDFQDAFFGPVTYDLVSLLRDCYIAWPENSVAKWVRAFWEISTHKVSFSEFQRWFDLMGLQRHLKALLTFARKYERDHNSDYLPHIPRTLAYVETIAERYTELRDFHKILVTLILPASEKKRLVCVQ